MLTATFWSFFLGLSVLPFSLLLGRLKNSKGKCYKAKAIRLLIFSYSKKKKHRSMSLGDKVEEEVLRVSTEWPHGRITEGSERAYTPRSPSPRTLRKYQLGNT